MTAPKDKGPNNAFSFFIASSEDLLQYPTVADMMPTLVVDPSLPYGRVSFAPSASIYNSGDGMAFSLFEDHLLSTRSLYRDQSGHYTVSVSALQQATNILGHNSFFNTLSQSDQYCVVMGTAASLCSHGTAYIAISDTAYDRKEWSTLSSVLKGAGALVMLTNITQSRRQNSKSTSAHYEGEE